MTKISFRKIPAPANKNDSVFSSETCFGAEFREFASIFVPRKGIPSCFLLCGMVLIRIPSVCFYFCSTEWNSELFSLPLRGMVQNKITKVFFYFCSTVQNSEHFSHLWNGTEWNSESFLFCGTAGIPPEQTNCSVYSVFRGINFFVGNCQPYE